MSDSENWATFPTVQSPKEDNDDWADFGGFETAQPITDPQASVTTGLISWAAMPTTLPATPDNSTGIPPQDHPGTHDLPDTQQQSPWATAVASHSMLSEQTQPETTRLEVEQHADMMSSAQTFTQPEMSSSVTDNELAVLSDNMATNNLVTNCDLNQVESAHHNKEIEEQKEKTQKAENLISDLEKKLTAAEQEKMQFKKDLQDVMNKNQGLEEESKTTKEASEEQKLRYSQLQDDHRKQILEIREAGHDALAIIIEEYKELCKQAVLEQKEKSQAELHLFLENEQQMFRETFKQQQESLEKTLSEVRASNEERVKSVLQAEQEKHQLLLESSLRNAQDESKTTMQLAVKEAIEQGQDAVKEAVTKEKEAHCKAMEEMEKLLHEEREKFKLSLEEAINEERKQSKIAIEEALVEERKRSRDALSKSVEETKAIMKDYTQQKLEAESKIHQRQFMAMDLFLESARTQLKSLMEGQSTS